ncbi:MAG: 5'/3'-nucleotidase SurE [Rhodospirillaceae bacterium]|nr:5'/3'-nucleotidase SurE [Rhodospirillaceae bacterium]MBT6884836.1 5'/3'-nucleotidase SurE [Rhodospirillaceae bacterium]MBT7250947.1 5'/3'-nucleotidase SurE [Rhodospirillaceae bacterium]
MNLKRARVLISNDDGIHAPGLKVLERVAKKLFKEVWVVAPETEQSAASHSLTIRMPLRIRRLSPKRFAVDGTPTDSVLLGVQEVMKDNPPDLVLSGINRGGNLGEDVTYSGTVAAAMEGTLLGIPSVALSQHYQDRQTVSWATAEHWTADVIKRLVKAGWPKGVLMNVNFPDVPAKQVTGIEVVRQGRRKIGGDLMAGTDPRGDQYFWIGAQRDEESSRGGTDLGAVNAGAIAVTPLTMDLTHASALKKLKAALA